MSLIDDILDPLVPDQPGSPSQTTVAPTPPVATTPPQPTTTHEPPPPVVITTSILSIIPTPEPPVQTTTAVLPTPPPPPNTTSTKARPQQTTTRGSSGGGGGSNGNNNNHSGNPSQSQGPSGPNPPTNGTASDVQRDTSSTGSGSTATIVGSLVGVAAAVVLILAGLLVWRKRQQKKQSFEALFGSSSLAAASGLNNDGASGNTESAKPIYARDVEDGHHEAKPISSPPPLAALEPAYGGGEQAYYQHPSAMSPVSAASGPPQGAYDRYDQYYPQGGEAYNMQDYNAYHQGNGGYDQYEYGHYPAGTAGAPAAGAHPDDLDSMAYYPYDQSGGAQGYQQQPSYSNSARRRP